MRYLLSLIFIAMLMAGCSGSGQFVKPVNLNKANPIFIEPIEPDDYKMSDRLAFFLNRNGFTPTTDANAPYHLKAGYTRSQTRVEVYVKIIDQTTSDLVYSGDGTNRGFGTAMMMYKADVIWSSFETALSGFNK